MPRYLSFFLLLLPVWCFSQVNISGRVLSQIDTKPVANASVFLSNASVGNQTGNDGTFILHNARPGKYQLVISIIGFDTYTQDITVGAADIKLPDILIIPKMIVLNEVKVKPHIDLNWDKYYHWFEDEFIGTSSLAADCKITNPETLDFVYDEKKSLLTASSGAFLNIENNALGYKIKFLLTDFSLDDLDRSSQKLHYKGSALFEEMKGTPSQLRRWRQKRQEIYEGSAMHFLRSVLDDELLENGFRVLRVQRHVNTERPADSIINVKIDFFKKANSSLPGRRDSLSFWKKKQRLVKMIESLGTMPQTKDSLLRPTNDAGLYAFGPGNSNDGFLITYNKYQHFYLNKLFIMLNDPFNIEHTLVDFAAPYAFFDGNGGVINPNSMVYSGVWSRQRMAELLPVDYEPPQEQNKQADNTVADSVIAKLHNFLTTNTIEKAYLQFDKPYYAAGDTMYFKAYVTIGERHQLSDMSGVLHVDLINTNNKINQSIKLLLDTGVTWGDFALPDTLPKGNYRVRAYTQWMRNNGETDFFDKTIAIGSARNEKKPENNNASPHEALPKPDLQFFPEGGRLVAGVRSRVAFKAIDGKGMGIGAKGQVFDGENHLITSFETSHLGMGCFYLEPADGETYKAKVVYAGDAQDVIQLPGAASRGIALSVNNDSIPKATVKIEANNSCFGLNKDKQFNLVIYSGGVATDIAFKLDSSIVIIDILKRPLSTGVATVTLFGPANEPLAERLLFIQNYKQLSINVNDVKNNYAKRGKVNIKLNVLNRAGNAVEGHFSVSVIDETKAPFDDDQETSIFSYLLLSSELRGKIEQPNYYFNHATDAAQRDLDVLMLTQGFRRFEWEPLLYSHGIAQSNYQPEKGLNITGQVNNLSDNPVPNSSISLIPQNGGPLLTATTDDKGVFNFQNMVFMDTTRFVLSALNGKGKNTTKITWFDKPDVPTVVPGSQQFGQQISDTSMATFANAEKLQQQEILNSGLVKGILLKQVNIRDKKPDDKYETTSLAGAGHADQVMHAGELERVGGQLSDALAGRLRGIIFVPGGKSITERYPVLRGIGTGPMLLVVDGAYIEPPDVNKIQINDVETVEVLKYASTSIYGMSGGNGVLIITTKKTRGLDPKDIPSIGVLPIAPMGFYKARQFYSPKYDGNNWVGKQKDLRSTVYWNPEIKTGPDGNASFEYYNADTPGNYKIIIEGIDTDGNLGRQVCRYHVE